MHRFIKQVGGGATRAESLTRDQARQAMALIADGTAAPVQVGAFLMALRMKGETADELAGLTLGLEPHLVRCAAPAAALEVDAHGDGHRDTPSLLPAAACAAAALGVPVCLGVEIGSPYARHGLDAALATLGLDGALTPARAARDLSRAGVAAIDLAAACPPLAALIALRPLLGRRTVAQTLAKLVSSSGARHRLVGVFHVPYLEPTAAALATLGVERGLVVQALGGLPEARPGKVVRVAWAGAGAATIDFSALTALPDPAATTTSDNLAALDGQPVAARRAAMVAALLLHAATGSDPLAAAREAEVAFLSGRARAVAHRLATP